MELSKSKLHKIIKKYTKLQEQQKSSWDLAQRRIHKTSPDGTRYVDEKVYQKESYNYQKIGNDLFNSMIDELKQYTIFKKTFNIPDVIQQSEQLFCPYCGHKKSFVVSTDINSGIVCKNRFCKGK